MQKLILIVATSGFALTPLIAFAQNQPAQPAQPPLAIQAPASATIPPDQQPTQEQLTKLFEVMRLRDQMQSYQKRLPAMLQQQIMTHMDVLTGNMPAGRKLTPGQQAAMGKLIDKYVEGAINIYSVDEMIGEISPIYQRHFTRDDVDAAIAFYSSPAGQHFINEQPAIMQEYMPLVMSRAQERVKQMTDDLEKEMTQLIKSFGPPASAPKPKPHPAQP